MGAYAKDVVADKGISETDERTLAELRKTIDGLAKDIATAAERQAKNAKDAVDAGASTVRLNIRRQPALAMGIAAAAGALVAITVVPRRSKRKLPSTWDARWDDWSPVTRADLHDVAEDLQRSMKRAMKSVKSVKSVPITSSLERVADALTKADQTTGVSSTLEKVGGWLSKMQGSATDKVKKS